MFKGAESMVKIKLELYDWQIWALVRLLLEKVEGGGDGIANIRTYLELYDTFNNILVEENSINQ